MNDNSKVIDENGNDVLDPKRALSEQTLAVDLSRAEFDQAIATAHRYPRILDTVVKQIETMACYNEESAENCIYSLPRGGKPIIGPSIGFANILATAWGNCIDGGRHTYSDRKEKLAYAEGVFHDLQSNRRTIIYESRRISGKNGALYSDDMIAVTGKAAAAVARRNAILNAVPRAIWHPIWEQALRIVRGDQETFAERKDKALRAFSQFGVKPEQVFMYLGLKGDVDLTLEHIPTLRGMYQALRDGSTTVEEMFDPRRMTGKGFETVADPLGNDDVVEVADATAGMGEAPVQAAGAPADKAPAGAAAPAEAANAATAKEAATAPSAASPGLPLAESAAPAAKGAPAATTTAAPAAAKEPTNAVEYIEHWRAFCAGATTGAVIKNKYYAERELRKRCSPFSEEQFEEMNRIKDDRIKDLGK
jgi:hypothetical protein